ncbi:phytanoyl-CoA dioxygenase family protein [Sandaracinobacteroides saxicola]|uniref:Phytanoyl-CoA dioxygenase family protein n=1 Tax=Sandaracinobacteroides saxicola TaxID=2759707 RepID=A0A7G5IHF0_9SPHN|nr:phytanoyl-CoA dioxygenase family protein [Sandaracinobacteroides saxicola]QMW22792.1 phytanoyl-CoA dioxygenase family protein [Sandaracinobacteroides saxicola]
MLTEAEREAFDRDGFFLRRGFAGTGEAMAAECITAIRADPPAAHAGEPAYATAEGLLVQPEAKPVAGAVNPEDHVSKLFNPHLFGATAAFSDDPRVGPMLSDLLGGADVDVFQSMFILKNPGAWGQPWHQDSHYFNFDQQPQIGLWLAISAATLDNGCLWVLPGSHRDRHLHAHAPDRRPGANHGYLEVEGLDERAAVPVTMEPGDLLVFDSYLLHKSSDNVADSRRAAMVWHYGRAGTRNLAPPAVAAMQARINIWKPVWRRAA